MIRGSSSVRKEKTEQGFPDIFPSVHAELGLTDVYGHMPLTVLAMEPEDRQMNHSLPSRTSHSNGGGEAHAAWGEGSRG